MKVLIVEDQRMILEMLESIVREEFPQAIAMTAGSLADALKLAGQEPPDLVLLDLGLPDSENIDTVKRFRVAHPSAKVMVVSVIEDRDSVLRAFDEGAWGYVPKSNSQAQLAAALQVVVAGNPYLPPQAMSGAASAANAARLGLSMRQLQVMRLIVLGLPYKEVAQQLKLAEVTVKYHAANAYHILGVSSRAQAMIAMARRGIRFD